HGCMHGMSAACGDDSSCRRGLLPAPHGARGAGAIVGDPASRPPLSEPRRRVIFHAGLAARQGTSLAQGVPPDPIAPARSPTAVSVRSVEAGGPRFLDCLPTIVDRIVAVGGIVTAVIRAGIVARGVRAAL